MRVHGLLFVFLGLAVAGCGDDGGGGADGSTGGCASDVECSDAVYCNGIEACAPSVAGADSRGCVPGPPPCADACDEATRTCAGGDCPDADGDGARSATCGGTDCDDADGDRFPGNIEVCDTAARDEDCNPLTVGGVDMDGDGAIDAACCNGPLCGNDCDDSSVDVGPSQPEICDGEDDDCDGDVDEDFECPAGAGPRECRNICGSLGTQQCTNACVWSACVAEGEGPTVADTCNRCDDDNDGVSDEGFECSVGAFLPCETQCGTVGQGFCSAECTLPGPTPATCSAATETCNYCDDDGDGTFDDDRGLVEPEAVLWSYAACADVTLGAGATCAERSFPVGSEPFAGPGVRLSDGVASNGRWQAWTTDPASVGWGRLDVELLGFIDTPLAFPGVRALEGGWAVVLANAPCGAGPFNDVGVPLDCEGIAFEWRFEGVDQAMVRRLNGDGSAGTQLGDPGDGTVPSSFRIGYGESRTLMALQLRYAPTVSGDDNYFRMTVASANGSMASTLVERGRGFGLGDVPADELVVGDEVHLGVVSGTGALPLTLDWALSGRFTFLSLPSTTVRATSACAP